MNYEEMKILNLTKSYIFVAFSPILIVFPFALKYDLEF